MTAHNLKDGIRHVVILRLGAGFPGNECTGSFTSDALTSIARFFRQIFRTKIRTKIRISFRTSFLPSFLPNIYQIIYQKTTDKKVRGSLGYIGRAPKNTNK